MWPTISTERPSNRTAVGTVSYGTWLASDDVIALQLSRLQTYVIIYGSKLCECDTNVKLVDSKR